MADKNKVRDEIISFVQNSPEEVNAKIAVFIAGMQAQKNLADCGQKNGNGLSVVKGGAGKK
jgi:citrate lyase synthetase